MPQRVAVVTGANRGIGLEIARQLAQSDLMVILTSRNKKDGLEAQAKLNAQGYPVRYHLLDVTHKAYILDLKKYLNKEFGRCDCLVNNAGIFLENKDGSILTTSLDAVRQTMETNVYGPLLLIQALVPLMKRNNYGRIVNMSSGLGQLHEMQGGYTAYRTSKTALNVLTRVLAAECAGTNILVNSMTPGWVKTRMGGPGALRSVERGADTALWLATLPDGGPSGKMFLDRQEVSW